MYQLQIIILLNLCHHTGMLCGGHQDPDICLGSILSIFIEIASYNIQEPNTKDTQITEGGLARFFTTTQSCEIFWRNFLYHLSEYLRRNAQNWAERMRQLPNLKYSQHHCRQVTGSRACLHQVVYKQLYQLINYLTSKHTNVQGEQLLMYP